MLAYYWRTDVRGEERSGILVRDQSSSKFWIYYWTNLLNSEYKTIVELNNSRKNGDVPPRIPSFQWKLNLVFFFKVLWIHDIMLYYNLLNPGNKTNDGISMHGGEHPSLWPSGIDAHVGTEQVLSLIPGSVKYVSYPMFIEPTITWIPSGFSGYMWLDTKKIELKKLYICMNAMLLILNICKVLGEPGTNPGMHLVEIQVFERGPKPKV